MKKICIVFLSLLLLCSCDSILNGISKQSAYFPLAVDNEWVYRVDYDGSTSIQTIKVIAETNGVYTLEITIGSESETTDSPNSFQYKVSYENSGVYTNSDGLIISENSTSFNASSLTRLFETHYSSDRIPGTINFENNGQNLTCEFVCTPDNTYNCTYIFSQSFEKGVGLKSWTDQKTFYNPFWGMEVDTWRGTLVSATIDGETTNY